MNALTEWMRRADSTQQKDLADRVGTSKAYLYQVSGGFRNASPELAAKIEEATEAMSNEANLPRVYRTDICGACSKCRFAHELLGEVVSRNDFDGE